jgi:predicted dehydrogenase
VHHHHLAAAAFRAGKHVYCEQPLGVSTAQAEELAALAKERGLCTMVGHQSHYEPATLHMAELVREGYIGRPLTFQHSYFVSNYIAPRPSHRQWLFEADMGGHPGYRSGHSLDRVHQVLGQDVTAICADMAVKVPERRALDRDGIIRSNQVENMHYLLRVGGDAMGTLQVSFTAWFGTGNHFEVYGTDGMLMLATDDSPAWSKAGGHGDPTRGALKLFGARVDMEQLLSAPTAPERLQKQFREIPVPSVYSPVTGIERGRATYLVAQTWHAFAQAIHERRECAPSFRDKLKIHRIWDAAEASVLSRSWQDVDYSGI